jgi:hypothetical protein
VGQNCCQLTGVPSRMWRWMIIFISLHPPTSEQHKTISGGIQTMLELQWCQVPKLFSGHYIEKVWPILEQVWPISQKRQCNIPTKIKIRNFFRKYSSVPFEKCCQNSATNSSGQFYFSPAPCELFGRNSATWQHCRVRVRIGEVQQVLCSASTPNCCTVALNRLVLYCRQRLTLSLWVAIVKNPPVF